MTSPFYKPHRPLTHAEALNLYSVATHLDTIPGTYPLKDPGSTGLAVMKVAKQCGYIKGYGHAFGINHALEALTVAPVVTGVNWYDGFYTPKHGTITKSGPNVGGHEFLVVGIDTEAKTVLACNSWGPHWGSKGYFEFSWSLWEELLHLDGDVTTALR
jgi:hypothetical protein